MASLTSMHEGSTALAQEHAVSILVWPGVSLWQHLRNTGDRHPAQHCRGLGTVAGEHHHLGGRQQARWEACRRRCVSDADVGESDGGSCRDDWAGTSRISGWWAAAVGLSGTCRNSWLGVLASCEEADAAAVQVHAHRRCICVSAAVTQEQQVRGLRTTALVTDI